MDTDKQQRSQKHTKWNCSYASVVFAVQIMHSIFVDIWAKMFCYIFFNECAIHYSRAMQYAGGVCNCVNVWYAYLKLTCQQIEKPAHKGNESNLISVYNLHNQLKRNNSLLLELLNGF